MLNSISNLPKDKRKIMEALIKKIENKYKDEIAIVVCYGSYITGSAYKKSDLDFFFIPKTDKGKDMQMQFLIDDIGYDFWPLSWERAERIANFKEATVSIIAEGIVVYYDKPEDLKKFNSLKQRIKEITMAVNDNNILINQAEKLLKQTKSIYFDMDYKNLKYEMNDSYCSKILNLLSHVIAYINSTYIKKGAYNIKNEVKEFAILPENFLEHFNSVTRSHSVTDKKELIKNIIINVEKLLQQKKSQQEVKSTNKKLNGFYEEIKSNYNKLINACENNDHTKVYFTVHLIEQEVKNMMGEKYKHYNFPNLIKNIYEENYKELKKLTYQHEDKLVSWLKENEVKIIEYENIDKFLADF